MHCSRYIGVVSNYFHETGIMGIVKSAIEIKSANRDPFAFIHAGFLLIHSKGVT